MYNRILMASILFACALCLCATGSPAGAAEGNRQPSATMLRYPDVSASQIVFLYAGDLWLVPREGGLASPLASPPGQESFPRFSPDGKTIAFAGNYDGNRDLYTIPTAGGIPFRVTHHPAGESLCDWTPDGRLLFSGYGIGSFPRAPELYWVPATGGLPEKLPVPYGAIGAVSPDGKWLAYTPYSVEGRSWKRYEGGLATDIWLFNLEDHSSKKITDWEGSDGVPMWHGDSIYYLSDAGPKHRRNIWVYDTKSGGREQVTHFADYDVEWPAIGPGQKGQGEIVFQNGPQLYLLDLGTRKSRAIEVVIPGAHPKLRPQTIDVKDQVHSADISPTGKRIVVEARGDIWTVPAEKGSPRNLTRTDGVAERDPSWSPDKKWIAYLSDATGEYELYIRPSDGKGEARQLTDDGQRFRYSPVWSPDSKCIVFTDNSSSLYLHTIETGETKLIDQDQWAYGISPSWSHDSRWIAYTLSCDNAQRAIWVYNVETGEKHQLTQGVFDDDSPTFDRKGEYLFYASSRSFESPIYEDIGSGFVYTGTQVLLAVPLSAEAEYTWAPKSDEETWDKEGKAAKGEDEGAKDKDEGKDAQGKSDEEAVDDGVSGVWEGTVTGDMPLPPGGLSFTITLHLSDGSVTGSMTAGPYTGHLTGGSYNKETGQLTGGLEVDTGEGIETFALTARIEGDSISGTVTGEEFAGAFTGKRTSPEVSEKPKEGEEKEKEAKKKVEIDIEGFERRGLQLPVPRGRFGNLAVNDKNQLIYVRGGLPGSGESSKIMLFDMADEKKQEKTVVTGAGSFGISADGKKLLVSSGGRYSPWGGSGGGFSIIDAKEDQKLDKKVSLEGMRATIDPRSEWRQVFTDAWRIQRDFFYAPNMHGVDWPAVREKYSKMLDDCASREDVTYVIGEMIGELNVGHESTWARGGEEEPSVSVGMLGCDFDLSNGAYRITKIYEGAPWDSDARGPFSKPGIDVKVGDYLLAVNRLPLDTSKDPWAALEGLVGRTVTLTVSEKPVLDDGAREVVVEPMGSDGDLRFRAWIEANRAYVEEKTDGKVGYIYVPDTGRHGQNELFRQFYGQRDKGALIIDERWNGGGQIPSRFIELLNRPVLSYWARRYGRDTATPGEAHQGPKCMLINGPSGSGGDCFPYYFRKTHLGKLIGTRTWGGLVGLAGNPMLIDGGYTSVPMFAFYETDGTWGIEGHGVDPDIEVIDDPALMVDGGDPQLDAAIAEMLEELERNPYVPPARPAYPDRSGMGITEEDK